MVGRLVQQQHVGRRQQQAAECYAALLATGQVLDLCVPGRQAQRIGGDFQLALKVVAVGGLQNGLQFALFGSQCVKVGIGLGVGGIYFVQPGLGILDFADGFLDDLAYGLVVVQLGFLRQVANLDARHGACFALDLGVDTGHDPQQRGFTCTVETQNANLGAGEKGQ